MMNFIAGLTQEELTKNLETLNIEPYRANQILQWFYQKNRMSFNTMSNIPKAITSTLQGQFEFCSSRIKKKLDSDDGTVKFAVELQDGELIEAVLIPEKTRNTLCISTQVGCPVGCIFCASGLFGLRRNLETHEIVEQIVHAKISNPEKKITNIVLMGIGEPLLNYNNVIKSLKIMHAEWGLAIGYHKITLSTAGVVDKIYKLINDKVTPNLAISLHAATDDLRKKLVPNIRKWSVSDLVNAAKTYQAKTKKDVTFEYVLLDGLNSDMPNAHEINELVKNSGIKLNLIPYNPVPSLPYKAPLSTAINNFQSAVEFATLRRPRGQDIQSACGQLRINETTHDTVK